MRMGSRRRVTLALAVVALGGYLAKWIFESGHGALSCSSAPARTLNLCNGVDGYRQGVRWAIVVLLAILAAAAVVGLARWALDPIRDLTATVGLKAERLPYAPGAQ